MSTINQMLRDLDARGANLNHSPIGREIPAAPRAPIHRASSRKKLIWLGLTGIGAVIATGAYMTWKAPANHTDSALSTYRSPPAAMPLPFTPVQKKVSVVNSASTLSTSSAVDAGIRSHHTNPSIRQPIVLPGTASHVTSSAKKRSELKLSRALSTETTTTLPRQSAQIAIEATPDTAKQLYDEAGTLLLAGKTQAAQVKYREALKRNPALVEARLKLANSMREQGDSDSAITLLKSGYAQQHDEILAVMMGRMYAELGQRDEALTWLTRSGGKLQPADFALMGALLSQEHRNEEAINAYQIALKTEPHKGGWLLGLGLALESTGQLKEAQIAFRQALEWGDFKPEVIEFLKKRTGNSLE